VSSTVGDAPNGTSDAVTTEERIDG
jgi:hypothetical protein